MINEERCIVIDLDGTICRTKLDDEAYDQVQPNAEVVEKLREYRSLGFYIIVYTSRQMRTYEGNVGLINANTAKVATAWLDGHQIPYDEIHFGKPWGGRGGFYVDDQTIRPDEFLSMSYEDIQRLLSGS